MSSERKKGIAKRERQRGVALLMVLIALTIIAGMTAELSEMNHVTLATTRNTMDSARAEYLARSGINLGRLTLSFQRMLGNISITKYAGLIIGMFASSDGGGMADLAGIDLSMAEGLGLDQGIDEETEFDLDVVIIPEDALLNVNVAADMTSKRNDVKGRMVQNMMSLMAPMVYDKIFEEPDKTGKTFERHDVVCEMIDWVDQDETLCDGSSTEDPTLYQELDPEYERKNAPFDSLQELHLVRGVDDDFWSAFIEPDPNSPESRVITVWGKGKINVNEAPIQTLYGLVCTLTQDQGVSPCMDVVQSEILYQVLQSFTFMRTFMPFKNSKDFIARLEKPGEMLGLTGLPGFTVSREGKAMAKRLISTKSTVFSIYATGTVGKTTKRIHAVVDMKGQDMLDPSKSVAASGGSILYWRME